MSSKEWALIAFTILSQMSIGSFVVLGIVHLFAARKAGLEEADRMSDRALLAIGPVLVLGIAASFFHLGNPLNSPRVIANLATSWLSREIVFVVLFSITGAIFALLQWRKIGSIPLRNAVAWLAALLGLAQVFSMSMVYMLPIQPYWDSVFNAPWVFFSTTFLLGSLAIGSALVANYTYLQRKKADSAETQSALLRKVIKGIAIGALVLLGIELLGSQLQVTLMAGSDTPAAVAGAALLSHNYVAVYGLRLALAFIGAGVFGLFLYHNAHTPGREKPMGSLVYAAFAVVLVAEIMGRFLFYAVHVKIGL